MCPSNPLYSFCSSENRNQVPDLVGAGVVWLGGGDACVALTWVQRSRLSRNPRRLRRQLLAFQMGIEGVFVPAIDSFSVLDGLVTFCISNASCEKHRAAKGNFQQ